LRALPAILSPLFVIAVVATARASASSSRAPAPAQIASTPVWAVLQDDFATASQGAEEAVKLAAGQLCPQAVTCGDSGPAPKPAYPEVIIGVNDALGRGDELAEAIFAAGFTSDRIEPLVLGRDVSHENTPGIASELGFIDNSVTVGDVNHGGPRNSEPSLSEWATEPKLKEWTARALGEVEEAAKYGNTLMEVGNEMFLVAAVKESTYPQPKAYAQMFVSLSRAVDEAKRRTAGYKLPAAVKLLFNLFGEYEESEDNWSKIRLSAHEYHGWLGDALEAPGRVGNELRTRVEGFTFHPYETRVRQSDGEWAPAKEPGHDWGTSGLSYDYAEARDLGFGDLPVYATELGFTTSGAVQAAEAKAEYEELLSFPEVKGIWYFAAGPETEEKTGLFERSDGEWKLNEAAEALQEATG
jgi:hypothetical protein